MSLDPKTFRQNKLGGERTTNSKALLIVVVNGLFEGNTPFRRDVKKLPRVHSGLCLLEYLLADWPV
jgi:hypothetical protein